MTRRRVALTLAALVAAAACFDITGSSKGTLHLSPILDSVFVGDSLPPRGVTLIDPAGQLVNPGPVTWTMQPAAVATVATSGEIHGVGRGQAYVTATASGASATALVVVSLPLDMTLLMDTVLLMPNDTFTIPLAIQHKNQAIPDTIRFDASPTPTVYAIDTVTGKVTAAGPGTARYVAHVRAGPSPPVADTGAVVVIPPANAASVGKFFLTVVGANTRHEGGAALAINYPRQDGKLAFLLSDTLGSLNSTPYEKLLLVSPDSIIGPGVVAIDTINPQEAFQRVNNAVCTPPRAWGIWQSILISPGAPGPTAFSHGVTAGILPGTLGVTQYVPVSGGTVISGRYAFTAQRGDYYFDPRGVVVIHGTFVSPLTKTSNCTPQ